MGVVPTSADPRVLDDAIAGSGLEVVETIDLASEWGEWAQEQDGRAGAVAAAPGAAAARAGALPRRVRRRGVRRDGGRLPLARLPDDGQARRSHRRAAAARARDKPLDRGLTGLAGWQRQRSETRSDPGGPMADQDPNADLKAKMREALDRKKGHHHPDDSADSKREGARLGGQRQERRQADAPPQGRWRRGLRRYRSARRSAGGQLVRRREGLRQPEEGEHQHQRDREADAQRARARRLRSSPRRAAHRRS